MLVLTRRLGESIQIGDNITVTVVRVTPTEVRLGIEAPAGTSVHRMEVRANVRIIKINDPNEPLPGM
jgi:carbon storage regulator